MPAPEDHRVGDDEAPEGSLGWLLWVLFGTVVLFALAVAGVVIATS